MKYTIEGLQQNILVNMYYEEFSEKQNKVVKKYPLDMNDAAILKFIIDFKATNKMEEKKIDNQTYFWIHYKTIIKQLPLLRISGVHAIANRFRNYIKIGLIKKQIQYVKKGKRGTFTFFRFTDKLYELLFAPGIESPPTPGIESPPKDSFININSSINKIYIDLLNYWNNKNIIVHKKEIFEKNIKKKHKDIIKLYEEDVIKQAIDNYSIVLESDRYYWSYRWGFLDFISKGIEKFKDEAKPLENFLKQGYVKKPTPESGKNKYAGFED